MRGESAAEVELVGRLRELNTRLESQRSGTGSLWLSQRSSAGGSNRQTTRCESVKKGRPKA